MNEKLQKKVIEQLQNYIKRIENGEITVQSSSLERPYVSFDDTETFEIRTYQIEYVEYIEGANRNE